MHFRQCPQLCGSLQTNTHEISSVHEETHWHHSGAHLLSREISLHLGKHLKPNHELLHLTKNRQGVYTSLTS